MSASLVSYIETQFIKRLSNTDSELKKYVVYKLQMRWH